MHARRADRANQSDDEAIQTPNHQAPMPDSMTSRRLATLPRTYIMEEMRQKRIELQARGVAVIDLSRGQPDHPAPELARRALARAAQCETFHLYPELGGSAALRSAMAEFYQRRYGVRVDPQTQILPLLGVKEGLVSTALAYADETRPIYIGQVNYPIFRTVAVVAGAPLVELAGGWDEGYVPRLSIDASASGGVMYIASPGNPTGAVIAKEQLVACIEACRRENVIMCFDATYIELYGSGSRPPLPLAVAGDHMVVELHSFSKSLSLAGWRVGFAVGGAKEIAALARMKSFLDAGMPTPQQLAIIDVLSQCDSYLDEVRRSYAERQTSLRNALVGLPLEVFPSDAAFFCWVRPQDTDGTILTQACMEEGVLALPGEEFGPKGKPFMRMTSLLASEQQPELRRRLSRALERARGL